MMIIEITKCIYDIIHLDFVWMEDFGGEVRGGHTFLFWITNTI